MRYAGSDAITKVTVTQSGTAVSQTLTVDDIVPIQAAPGCQAVPGDATKATCIAFNDAPGRFLRFEITTGGGSDVVTNATRVGAGVVSA